eukprot:RCo048147
MIPCPRPLAAPATPVAAGASSGNASGATPVTPRSPSCCSTRLVDGVRSVQRRTPIKVEAASVTEDATPRKTGLRCLYRSKSADSSRPCSAAMVFSDPVPKSPVRQRHYAALEPKESVLTVRKQFVDRSLTRAHQATLETTGVASPTHPIYSDEHPPRSCSVRRLSQSLPSPPHPSGTDAAPPTTLRRGVRSVAPPLRRMDSPSTRRRVGCVKATEESADPAFRTGVRMAPEKHSATNLTVHPEGILGSDPPGSPCSSRRRTYSLSSTMGQLLRGSDTQSVSKSLTPENSGATDGSSVRSPTSARRLSYCAGSCMKELLRSPDQAAPRGPAPAAKKASAENGSAPTACAVSSPAAPVPARRLSYCAGSCMKELLRSPDQAAPRGPAPAAKKASAENVSAPTTCAVSSPAAPVPDVAGPPSRVRSQSYCAGSSAGRLFGAPELLESRKPTKITESVAVPGNKSDVVAAMAETMRRMASANRDLAPRKLDFSGCAAAVAAARPRGLRCNSLCAQACSVPPWR